jgi:hypothetical protein
MQANGKRVRGTSLHTSIHPASHKSFQSPPQSTQLPTLLKHKRTTIKLSNNNDDDRARCIIKKITRCRRKLVIFTASAYLTVVVLAMVMSSPRCEIQKAEYPKVGGTIELKNGRRRKKRRKEDVMGQNETV